MNPLIIFLNRWVWTGRSSRICLTCKPNQTKPKFRKDETEGFNSKSSKLDFYLHQYEEWGYDPLPSFVQPPESPAREPEFVEKYPLILITGQRIFNFFGSEHRQSRYLRKSHPDPRVEIHPDTAKARGIEEGDWVTIESPRGKVKFRAKVFEGIDPAVVSAEFGWWFPEKDRTDAKEQLSSNINVLTNDAGPLDPGIFRVSRLVCVTCVSFALINRLN